MNRALYPPDWEAISLRIRERAGWVCQDCGMKCRRPGEPFDTQKRTMSVHHIGVDKPDGTPGDVHDKMDCRDENLIALCARCHLRADIKTHVLSAAATRRRKAATARREAGQMELPL